MALLNDSTRSLRGVNATLLALLVLAVTGCVLMQQLGWMDPPVAFSHSLHVETGLSCDDCHTASGGDYARAEVATCLMCHEDIDSEKEPALHAATVMAAADAARASRPLRADDVIFSHAKHEQAGVGCTACHGDVEAAVDLSSILAPSMTDCTSCHVEQQAASDCRTCHSVLDTDVAPSTHAQAWMLTHGQVVRAELGHTVDDCAMCHTETSCVECHKDTAPASHNNAWRLRAHGIAASMDRESCDTCHTTDSCVRCHEDSRPISHVGSFAQPRNTHCLGCHEPLQQEQGCAVCHTSTPSHFSATSLPDDHSPAMNCRQCHGVEAPLPHVDNGSACIFCHK